MCAADGERVPLWRARGVPCTRGVVPERECRPDRLKVSLCCTSLESISGMLQKMPWSGVAASAATVAHPLTALELVPFIRGERQFPACYHVR